MLGACKHNLLTHLKGRTRLLSIPVCTSLFHLAVEVLSTNGRIPWTVQGFISSYPSIDLSHLSTHRVVVVVSWGWVRRQNLMERSDWRRVALFIGVDWSLFSVSEDVLLCDTDLLACTESAWGWLDGRMFDRLFLRPPDCLPIRPHDCPSIR